MKTNVDNPTSARASEITTQTNVTALRDLHGTVYHNLTGKPLFAAVSINLASMGSDIVYCDSNAAPITIVQYLVNNNIGTINLQISLLVLPNYYYKITGDQTLSYWFEYS
jgi:hypothetical protein